MATKVQTKENQETEVVETVNIAESAKLFTADLKLAFDAEDTQKTSYVEVILKAHELREEEGDKLTRKDLGLILATAIAEAKGVELELVTERPLKPGETKTKGQKYGDPTLYSLRSTILSMAWPKGEKEDAKVKKYLEKEGNKAVFVKLRDLSRKPHTKADKEPPKVDADSLSLEFTALWIKAVNAGFSKPDAKKLFTDCIEVLMEDKPKAETEPES